MWSDIRSVPVAYSYSNCKKTSLFKCFDDGEHSVDTKEDKKLESWH